jgi:PD-(D/E)XK endonuclease
VQPTERLPEHTYYQTGILSVVRAHHTKDKGDIGVAHAIADLADQGFVVLMALCEHAPFDLVGYRDGKFVRVQVKYRALSASGTIEVQFRSMWSDSKGTHVRPLDKEHVDVVCIYCPDTRACYYVDPKRFGRSVSLRVTPSRNRQQRNVLLAEAFRSMPASA